ncbi:scavenger receptor class B member 1 [Musca vetustissima]|uniref:scavenger receptor class B member 1 n=1 Tax=Musca vetustissima TaxID=27455 RepID=UPI002AB6F6E0|nr:scavenger receptor class B member 1 [Musca vetustissima]
MNGNKCFKTKLVLLGISGAVFLGLFIVSLCVDYQQELLKEHIRFRKGFISQLNWIDSPYGRLKMYIFNITNAEAFLAGNDTRIHVQEVGPIVYRIVGRNEILNQTEDSVTFRKLRYEQVEFMPHESCSPDILNQTIVLPNLVLLGAAAKLHDWVFLVRHAFNAITINESIFLTKSVYYFLWDFTVPALSLLAQYVPNIVSNCGLLYNAIRQKDEVYKVRIGMKNGFENFFRIEQLNGKTYFPERRANYLHPDPNEYCPINVDNNFDNSMFPPMLQPQEDINIVAIETCRTMKMHYDGPTEMMGLKGYRYVLGDRNDRPSCMDSSMGIKLPKGMYDVAKCLINDVPSAFSLPHFYGSSYNYSEHYVGFAPDPAKHQPSITIEPISGIPLDESYRFQSNIPMPDMKGYSKDLQKLSNMIIPNFWYEYNLDEYPARISIPLKLNVKYAPILQPIFIALFLFISLVSFLKLYLLIKQQTLKELFSKYYSLIREFREKK